MSDYEVELKFPLTDRDALAASLKSIGAKRVGEVAQADKYFSHPVRKFEQTDEALRLRSEGDSNCLTYKGPLLDRTTKTRQEIELALADGAEDAHKAWAILRALGFEDVYTVRKHRTTYAVEWEGRQFTLAVDRVDDLGDYVEIETLASAHNWEPARDAAQRLAEQLHLTPSERRSYLQLLLERQRRPTP
jgi:adenylate cyclase class 2